MIKSLSYELLSISGIIVPLWSRPGRPQYGSYRSFCLSLCPSDCPLRTRS